MAKCKCRICGTPHNTNDAYKVVVNNKSQYYCSQEEYEKDLARKKKAAEDKDKVYNLICDMFGYEIQNTQFFAEWVLWNKLKTNDVIYKYLRENEDYLQQICDREFGSEYQKIRYFSAVLKNSMTRKIIFRDLPNIRSESFLIWKKRPQVFIFPDIR